MAADKAFVRLMPDCVYTQMDKASIVKDAIEYIQQLQQLERQLLAELALHERHQLFVAVPPSTGAAAFATAVAEDDCAAVSPTKKMKRNPSFSSPSASHGSSSAPVDALEVRSLANYYVKVHQRCPDELTE